MHYLLFYTYVPDVLERRAEFRGAHLKHARASIARKELLLGGAFADPVDGGGLVTKWLVREWTTVVGEGAAHPLPPGV